MIAVSPTFALIEERWRRFRGDHRARVAARPAATAWRTPRRRQERVKTGPSRRQRSVRPVADPQPDSDARLAPPTGGGVTEGSVADLAYALLIILGFALLALTLRGLDAL